MATATHRNQSLDQGLGAYLSIRLQHLRAAYRLAQTRRAVFRRTFNELAGLTDRELADIGIPRAHIRRVARDAARLETYNG